MLNDLKVIKEGDKHMNPLSKRTRITLWGILLLIFLVLGPIILLYSLGYRYSDIEDKFTWIQTGGIYIHSDVSNTELFIDGEYYKDSGTIIRNTLIQNLRAGEDHIVEVHKEGYHSWVKELVVFESLVTEGTVVMLPTEIESSPVYPFVDIEGNGTTTDSAITILNPEYIDMEILFDLREDPRDSLTERVADSINLIEEDSTTTDEDIDIYDELGVIKDELDNLIELEDEVAWLEEGNITMYWSGREEKKPYYYCSQEDCKDSFGLDWDSEIIKFDFLGNRNDVWAVLDESGVWAVEVDDRSTRNIQPIYLGEGLDFRKDTSGRIVILDQGVFFELEV